MVGPPNQVTRGRDWVNRAWVEWQDPLHTVGLEGKLHKSLRYYFEIYIHRKKENRERKPGRINCPYKYKPSFEFRRSLFWNVWKQDSSPRLLSVLTKNSSFDTCTCARPFFCENSKRKTRSSCMSASDRQPLPLKKSEAYPLPCLKITGSLHITHPTSSLFLKILKGHVDRSYGRPPTLKITKCNLDRPDPSV